MGKRGQRRKATRQKLRYLAKINKANLPRRKASAWSVFGLCGVVIVAAWLAVALGWICLRIAAEMSIH